MKRILSLAICFVILLPLSPYIHYLYVHLSYIMGIPSGPLPTDIQLVATNRPDTDLILPAGTFLHAPNWNEYGAPLDVVLEKYKIYVRLSPETIKKIKQIRIVETNKDQSSSQNQRIDYFIIKERRVNHRDHHTE